MFRAIYGQQQDVAAYVALCKKADLSSNDCLAIAAMLKARRKPDEALAWVERGIALEKKDSDGSMDEDALVRMKRELLAKLGRGGDALEDAWAEFRKHPDTFSYEELMRFLGNAIRVASAESRDDHRQHEVLGRPQLRPAMVPGLVRVAIWLVLPILRAPHALQPPQRDVDRRAQVDRRSQSPRAPFLPLDFHVEGALLRHDEEVVVHVASALSELGQ